MKQAKNGQTLSHKEFSLLLQENGYRCNADARKTIAEQVSITPRRLPQEALKLIFKATEFGCCYPYEKFPYEDAYGNKRCAEVRPLYDIPEAPNSFLVCFSGYIPAPIYAMEILRYYAKKHGKLLPFLAIGKGGNKGLFEKLYNRENGIIRGSEAEAYCNIMSMMAPGNYARKYRQEFNDMDTAGNLRELYHFAKEQGLSEVTYVLCTGQAWYDKRVLAEWMLMLKQPEFAYIKINLILAHCPIWMTGHTPDNSLSEISLGYMAASIGPLKKDTISFDGKTDAEHPERYLMPDVADFDWTEVEHLIRHYGNMGWPNYSEILYGTPHEKAVEEIILADLFARNSFTPKDYDNGIKKDVATYQMLHGKFSGTTEEEFLQWLMEN